MENIPLFQQYLIRRGALSTERATWLPQYRELSKFVMPRTGRFLLTDQNRGDKRHNSIIDSTATRSMRVLAAGLMAGMTSPARPWFRLSTFDSDLMQYDPVKLWLNTVAEKMRLIFQRSNTYRSLHMMYEELGLYGTAASIVLDDFDDVLRHYVATCGEYMIAANAKGIVDTLYREFMMTVAGLVGEFGLDAVSPHVRDLYKMGRNLDAWIPVMHVIEPRSARNERSPLSRDLAFTSCYMELQPANPNATAGRGFLRESGFKTFPALVPRWHATGGDVYGNGPGMESLGDTKQLQHGQTRKTQAVDYGVKPPLQIPTAMKNSPLSTLPGGAMYYDQANPHGGIRSAFEVKLDIAAQLEDIRDCRDRIKQAWYVDLFLMLAQSEYATGDKITASQVAEMHEEKLLMLGPVTERLDNEMLKPKIDMTFERMLTAGILRSTPPPPEMHGQEINVEFVGMLAQAQRAIGVGSVDRLVQTIGTIAVYQHNSGMSITAWDKLDTDELTDQYADMLGVDPRLIVADEKVALIRKDRADQMAAQQKLAAAPALSKSAKDLASAGPSGQAAVDDIIGKFSGYSGPGQPVAA